MNDRYICTLYMDPYYSELRVDTDLYIDDEDLLLCLTMVFMTVKELSSMIEVLTKAFEKKSEKQKANDYLKPNKKKIPTTRLPADVINNIEKIKNLQKFVIKFAIRPICPLDRVKKLL